MERRLSAVLCADVVGYSRLMGTNEVATLTALNERRSEILEPSIAAHNGRQAGVSARVSKRGQHGNLRDVSEADDGVPDEAFRLWHDASFGRSLWPM